MSSPVIWFTITGCGNLTYGTSSSHCKVDTQDQDFLAGHFNVQRLASLKINGHPCIMMIYAHWP